MKAAARVVLCLLLVPLLYGQERQPFTLSVDVDLVVLNVRVLDRNGQSLHGLAKENFEVREDGTPQDIAMFIGQESPATIGLVLDASSSINSKRSDIKTAALRFIQSGHPRDQTFVLYFNEHLHWPLASRPFTDDIHLLEQALAWNGLGGRTALYDALAAAMDHSSRGEWEKRALVVLTDGGDNASSTTLDHVLKLAQESNVTIYTIGMFDPLAMETSRSVLHKLAKLTGGNAYAPDTVEQLAPIWEEISIGIRSQYTIAYRPDKTRLDGKFHKISVRVDGPGHAKVTVHTRPGYRARKAKAES